MRTHELDRAIEQADGVLRWHELVRGEDVTFTLYGRHLRTVLLARPAYLAGKPKLRYVVPTLRLVKPDKKTRSA